MARQLNQSQMGDAACGLVGHGLRVLPVHWPIPTGCSCADGGACTKVGKHPLVRAWQHDAQCDRTCVRAWWTRWPDANIGVVTAGLLVIDVDPRHGGDASLLARVRQHGPLPDTWTVGTGGGGVHLWFALPAGCTVVAGANKLGQGVDVKAGPGCYVIAPPSLHAAGARYEWLAGPDDEQLSPPPAWAVTALTPAPASTTSCEATAGEGDGNTALMFDLVRRALRRCSAGGGRNDAAFWLACQLRDNRFSRGLAVRALSDFAACCPAGGHAFTDAEARACVAQAYSRPPRAPWSSSTRINVFRGGQLEHVLVDRRTATTTTLGVRT